MVRWVTPSIWAGGECWIMGGGPSIPRQFGVPEDVLQAVMAGQQPASAYSPFLAPLHDKHVIGVNNAYQIGDWIDAIFFGDCAWYNTHRLALAKWPNLKVTCCNRFEGHKANSMEGIKFLAKDTTHRQGISSNPSTVSWNGNSGAAAISLAAHFGVRRIILLGFDMRLDAKGVSHWHGWHGPRSTTAAGRPRRPAVKPPPFVRHLKGFAAIVADAKARNIELINANPDSAIQEVTKRYLMELL